MWEWLLKKAIESPGESYPPETVKQMLDQHRSIIRHILESEIWVLIVITVLVIFYVISNEIDKKKLRRQLKSLQNSGESEKNEKK